MTKLKNLSLLAVVLLAGCSSQAERLARCEAQGVSRDACYIADQNRQATMNAAAEKQALENAAKQYAQSVHRYHKTSCEDLRNFHAQGLQLTPKQVEEFADCQITAHVEKGHTVTVQARKWSGYGVTVERHADGLVYVDGKAAALDETTEKAKVYSQGLNQVVIYNNGKANLIVNGVVKGWLK